MDLKIVGFIILVSFSASVIGTPEDFCGKCSPISGVKCIDERAFAFCDRDGFPTNRMASCPENMKCVNSMHICARAEQAACKNKCKQCKNGRFTCISKNAFSLCFGRNQTSTVAAKCALGKVCSTAKFDPNSENPTLDFCFDEILLEPYEIDCVKPEIPAHVPVFHPLGPARPPTNLVFPTPSRPYPAVTDAPFTDELPASFCSNKKPGKYQIATDGTCQRYYVCYQKGMNMVGDILTCAAHSVFDPTVQKCVRPSAGFYTLHKCGVRPRNVDANRETNEKRRLVSPYVDVSPMARSLVPDQTDNMDEMESLTPFGVAIETPRTARVKHLSPQNLSPLHRSNIFSTWNPYNYAHPISPPLTFDTVPIVNPQGNQFAVSGDDFISVPNRNSPLQHNPVHRSQLGVSSWDQISQTNPINPLLPKQLHQTLWRIG